MKKIDSKKDLPDWFKLESYKATHNYSAINWFQALCARQLIISLVEYAKDDGQLGDTYRSSATSIRENPGSVECGEDPSLAQSMGLFRVGQKVVKSMTYLDLGSFKERAERLERNGTYFERLQALGIDTAEEDISPRPDELLLREALARGLSDANINSLRVPVFDAINSDVSLSQSLTTYVRVNLGASDAVIKKAFSEWLAEAREQQGFKPQPKLLYERWAKYAVLPYLDLTIWAQENAFSIPDRVLAAAILPRREDGIDNLRKTTRPLARELMGSLAQLQALAALELKEVESSTE